MKMKNRSCAALLSLGLVLAPSLPLGGQTGSTTPTIDPAKTGNSENETTRKIRQELAKDKSLSSYAKNVKVMALGDRVVLRGQVRSVSERKIILACAKKYAGDTNVVDQTIIAK